MTRPTVRFLLLAAATCLLTLATPAQRGGEGGDVPDVSEKLEMQQRRKRQAQEQEEMLANLTPEERLERGTRRGSRNHCRFVAACRPPKLMPGQSGTLMISAILQGNAVLPSPAQVTLVPLPNETAIRTGDLFVRPASPGKLAPAYQGRPVYENTAIMEVPVTLAPTAPLGDKQLIALDLKFDVYDGTSGQPIGRFIERVSTNLEVGPYTVPDVGGRQPSQEAPAALEGGESDAVEAPIEPRDGAASTGGAGDSDAMGGKAAEISGDEDAAEPTSGGYVPPEDVVSRRTVFGDNADSGPPVMLLVGGGVILALIVLMLVRRK